MPLLSDPLPHSAAAANLAAAYDQHHTCPLSSFNTNDLGQHKFELVGDSSIAPVRT